MSEGRRFRRHRGSLACAFGVLAVLSAPTAAPAMTASGALSPRLAELAKPSVRSAPKKAQARKLGLPATGPGSLLRQGNRVLVEARFARGLVAGVSDLRSAGAKVVDVSPRYKAVTAAITPAELGRLDGVPHLASTTPVLTPIVSAAHRPVASSVLTPCFGAATSEGYEQLRVDQAQAEYEVDGTGEKVGILSDSFNRDAVAPTGAPEDVATGDLPGIGNPCGHEAPVEVLDDSEAEGEDEGRAMSQIVHDLAPGAEISFATAFTGLTGFAANIHALAAAGANVIADDVAYFEEPFFQEGPVGVAAREVTESGVSYFSAAGNDNLIHEGRNIASWEAPAYRDSGTCPPGVVKLSEEIEEVEGPGTGLHPTHCMDFNPGSGPSEVDKTFEITVAKGATLIADLQWAEPWEGVATDIDAYLLGPGGTVIGGSAEDNVFTTKQPFELVGWENETGAAAHVQLVINRYSGAANPRLKFALLENGSGVTSTEYETSSGGDVVGPTIFGHAGDEAAMGVGAVEYGTKEEPEFYSSRGPVTHYFGPVNGTVPALPLGSPAVIPKPDLVATDGGANTFFGFCESPSSPWRFYGTSAAAPHAAAVAALERQAKPSATPAEIEEAQREAAQPVGVFPATAVGSGLVDAAGTLEKLGITPVNPGATPVAAPASQACLPPRKPPVPPPPPPPTEKPVPQSAPPAPPNTVFKLHPRKLVPTKGRTAKVVFRFGSDQTGVTFFCKVDRAPLRECPPRLVRKLKPGSHVVSVKARNSQGLVDPTPAVFRFRVKRIG